MVSVLMSVSAHFILAKAFSSHFLPVDVVLYPLSFSWIVSFYAVLWNDSHRLSKNEYPKIKSKAADVVNFGVEPDRACSSHICVGKVVWISSVLGLVQTEFLGCFTLMLTLSSYNTFVPLLSHIPCPIFQGVFPYLWTLRDARKVRLYSEMWKC